VNDLLDAINTGWAWKGLTAVEVVDVNAFGNVVARSSAGAFWRICPEELDAQLIAGTEEEYASLRADPDFVLDWRMDFLVQAAAGRLGPAGEGRCYYLVIPSVLGGAYDVDNMATISITELVECYGGIACKVDGLPDGAQVELQVVD
jgi:hypothetical protein